MRQTRRYLVCSLAIALVALPVTAAPLDYPKTKRIDHHDDYHGTSVHDPYRWLEKDVREAKDVADWVEAQNKVTLGYLESIAEREVIRNRLTELWDYEKLGTPWKRGGRYFFTRNTGLQNQNVLYVTSSWDDEPRVLLDPNGWSEDGTVALAGTVASPDGRYLAYGVAEASAVSPLPTGSIGSSTRASNGLLIPGVSSMAATTLRRRTPSSRGWLSIRSSSTTGSARRRRTMCSFTRLPTIRTGAFVATLPRTAATSSFRPGRAAQGATW